MNWLIGAGPVCDMMIDEPSISSQHCRLTSSGGDLLLNDLNSTNGTWVNGTRISAATRITRSDTIRLGTQVPLPWPDIERLSKCRVIRIGRDTDNDVVVSDERVSGHHARLLVDGQRITLIDLESGNGTALGKPENKTKRAVVSADDDVFFASSRFRVKELLQHTGDVVPSQTTPWYRHPAVWIATAAAVVLICAQAFRGPVVAPPPSGSLADVADAAGVAPVVSAAVETVMDTDERLRQALFAVVVRSSVGEPGLRVGTAWAIADRKLATSGSLALFLQQSTEDFPVVVVQAALDGREHKVISSAVHAMCRKNADQMRKLGQQIEELRVEFEKLTDALNGDETEPAGATAEPGSVEKLAAQILDLEDQWFVSAEDMIHFDVGLLVTDESLSRDTDAVVLEVADEQPSRLAAVTITGAAFPHDQSIVTEPSDLPLPKLACVVESFVTRKNGGVARPVLRCSAEHVRQNWMGAPALNADGRVVGLYSRPTPSLQPDTPPSGEHCDIVSVKRLHDLLSESE